MRPGNGGRGGGTGEGPVGVLEAVAGDGADHPGAGRDLAGGAGLEQAGHAGGRGELAEDGFLGGPQPVGGQDLPVGNRVDQAAGLVAGGFGQAPGGGVADPDGGGDGLRVQDGLAGDDGGGAAGLATAKELEQLGIPVLLTAQVDSVGMNDKIVPANVRAAVNFYQHDPFTIQGRSEIRAADPKKTVILGNFRSTYVFRSVDESNASLARRAMGGGHIKMELDPATWARASHRVRVRGLSTRPCYRTIADTSRP